MNIIRIILKIISKISNFLTDLYYYRHLYKITGIFATRKFKKAKNQHRYAVLIAARNEEAVIGNLIESIKSQDYPAELVTTFVVADNCTDKTAEIARSCGAICYERTNPSEKTKGYALRYLIEQIKRDYTIEAFEGYFIFDADNLLNYDYITKMNESFDSGEKIITSYRNSKNFCDNWISASYGIHWLRTIRNEHRARSLFRLATRIQGTGFLFSNELIKNGWKYVSLTEDRAFCADAVAKGYKISYNHNAIFYDEQPTDLKIAIRQRIRWAKGHLQAFFETGPKLFLNIFYTGGQANVNKKIPLFKKIINNLRYRFMSFDMLTVVFPRQLTALLKKIIVYSLRITLVILYGSVFSASYAPEIIQKIMSILNIRPSFSTTVSSVFWVIFYALAWSIDSYINGVITAIYIFIVERKRIRAAKLYKKLWFAFTFPIFDIIGKYSMLIAVFKKVEWKAIPHNSEISISDLNADKSTQKALAIGENVEHL